MDIFMTSYILGFLLTGTLITLAFVFISLSRETVSPEYRKEMLVAARELEELEAKICSDARRRLSRKIAKGGF